MCGREARGVRKEQGELGGTVAGGRGVGSWRAPRKDICPLSISSHFARGTRERLPWGLRGFGQAGALISVKTRDSVLQSAEPGNVPEKAWKELWGCQTSGGEAGRQAQCCGWLSLLPKKNLLPKAMISLMPAFVPHSRLFWSPCMSSSHIWGPAWWPWTGELPRNHWPHPHPQHACFLAPPDAASLGAKNQMKQPELHSERPALCPHGSREGAFHFSLSKPSPQKGSAGHDCPRPSTSPGEKGGTGCANSGWWPWQGEGS